MDGYLLIASIIIECGINMCFLSEGCADIPFDVGFGSFNLVTTNPFLYNVWK